MKHALALAAAFGLATFTAAIAARPAVNPDADGDGIEVPRDQCPMQAEDKDGYLDDDGCPDPDNDLDGVPDDKDKDPRNGKSCANDPEDADGFEDGDGCPDPDNDKDGIVDLEDLCPDVAAGPDGLAGCPKGTLKAASLPKLFANAQRFEQQHQLQSAKRAWADYLLLAKAFPDAIAYPATAVERLRQIDARMKQESDAAVVKARRGAPKK